MMWDSANSTALAKHEVVYELLTDQAIYVKFKVVDMPNRYLVIWCVAGVLLRAFLSSHCFAGGFWFCPGRPRHGPFRST
jgi:hypothetical protein